MNEALIIILVLLWAVALLPGALQSRSRSTHATVGGFERAMAVLKQRPDGRYLMVPADARRVVDKDPGPGSDEFAPRLVSAEHPVARAGAVAPVAAPTVRTAASGRNAGMLERRRRMFTAMVASAVFLTVVSILLGGRWWLLWGLSVASLGAYTALLLHYKRQAEMAADVVAHLPVRAPQAEPVYQRVAGDGRDMAFAGRGLAGREDESWAAAGASQSVRIRRWED